MHVKLEQPKLTIEEFLALPDNGTRRWLIDGVVKEWPTEGAELEPPMTVRNRFHSAILVNAATELKVWLRTLPEPRGQVVGGEAGFIIARDPLLIVGIDVAYVTHEVMARQNEETTLIDGIPLLAVEILSPNDTIIALRDKRTGYRRAGVRLVWVIDPDEQTVTVHELGARPRIVSVGEDLVCEPHLPGFRVPVARLFA